MIICVSTHSSVSVTLVSICVWRNLSGNILSINNQCTHPQFSVCSVEGTSVHSLIVLFPLCQQTSVGEHTVHQEPVYLPIVPHPFCWWTSVGETSVGEHLYGNIPFVNNWCVHLLFCSRSVGEHLLVKHLCGNIQFVKHQCIHPLFTWLIPLDPICQGIHLTVPPCLWISAGETSACCGTVHPTYHPLFSSC